MSQRAGTKLWVLGAIVALAAVPAVADSHAGGFSADLGADYERSSGMLLQLAEAIPADTYDWRPAEGVRSVSEVFMHVASAQHFLLSSLGHDMPEGVREMEAEITDKAAVVETLKASIEKTQKALAAVPADVLDEQVELFGNSFSKRRVLLTVLGHVHEHLGQAIAYARSNGVTPPWSQKSDGGDEGGEG